MANALPPPSEHYLERLERALWPLASDERDSILLELRGYLAERGGGTLVALGEPQALAREYLAAGAGEGGPAALPERVAPRRVSSAAMLGQVGATFRGSRNGLFTVGAVLVTALIASDWALFTLALRPSAELPAWAVMLGRTAAVLAALCAAYRLILSDRPRAWEADAAMLRFAGATLLVFAGSAATALAAMRLAGGLYDAAGLGGAALAAARATTLFVTLAAVAVALLRIHPWLAALAIGRREITLARSWSGTRGRTGMIGKGWALLVLPLYLLHFLLSYAAVKLFPLGAAQLVFAGLDGIVSAAMALAAALLNATIFRWVAGEPTPAPRRFAPEPGSVEQVEAARLRLSQLAGPPVRGKAGGLG